MTGRPVLIDSDVLSALSRGQPKVTASARAYLALHGRLTLSAITVFERMRGYRAAIRRGMPFEPHMRQFEMLVAGSIVLPVDAGVADSAARIWAHVSAKLQRKLGDILIAATASANGLPLVTRNRRDFMPMTTVPSVELELAKW